MNSHPLKLKEVKIRFLEKRDFAGVVSTNQEQLITSYIIVDGQTNEVIVRDGNAADMKFRNSAAGQCMPTGNHEINGALYRTYRVSAELLK